MEHVELGTTGQEISRIGLGAMPLSLEGRPERSEAKEVVVRAVELGVTFIDTADSYCKDESDTHHNERLIAEALDGIGARDRVVVATKGGLVRPGGRWERDGRPEHLRRACEGSLAALGVERIDLYQLHAPDPRVPWEESVGAVAGLREEGKVRWVGLSNVSLEQIEAARRIVPVTSVQNRYNPWDRSAEADGIVDFCHRSGITFIPYSPVGGSGRVAQLRDSEVVGQVARSVRCSNEELVLAWILGRSPTLVPIPGASRTASIESSARAPEIELDPATERRVAEALEAL